MEIVARFQCILLFFLISCASPEIGDLINQRTKESFMETKSFPTYFTTTRRKKANSGVFCDTNAFGNMTATSLYYGECPISVPSKHAIGDIPWQNVGDRDSKFLLQDRKDWERVDFFRGVSILEAKELLVFVHGFNVNFDEAMVRGAQIRYDLKFQGPILVFSWPAGASESSIFGKMLLNNVYDANLEEAKQNQKLFLQFLEDLIQTEKRIHLLVHSMGHQVVLPALVEFQNKNPGKKLGELVLNAPDFDKKEFQSIATSLARSARRVTLYCSPGDNALLASEKVNGAPRAGMCFRFPNIDVINVNEVDAPGVAGLGHGYYAGRPILTDLYQVLLGVETEKRLFIRKSGPMNGENFVLRK